MSDYKGGCSGGMDSVCLTTRGDAVLEWLVCV